MKPIYTNTAPKTGVHVAGLISVDAVPREWLAADPEVNFATGIISTPVALQTGKSWISLQFTEDSYSFEQKQKSNKGGSFYELLLSGTTNDLDPVTRQLFETLRYHDLVLRLRDRQKRLRLVGNRNQGVQLQVTDKENNANAGTKIVTVDMAMDAECLAPFYLVAGAGSGSGGDGGNDPVGISPLFLASLNENKIYGGVNSLLEFYENRTTATITTLYNTLVQQATDSIINIALANNNGLQKSEYLIDPDLSSLGAFISYLNAWLKVNGTGQSLVLQDNELRLVDPGASSAYIGIAIPRNLLAGSDQTLLLAW